MERYFQRIAVCITLIFALTFKPLSGQDSTFRISPSGTSVAEARFIFVSMPEDFIGEKKTVPEGSFRGLGLSFHSNLFANTDETKHFRTGDYIGASAGIGGSKYGFWYHLRADIGWQFHYAVGKRTDIGLRIYGMAALDRISYTGVMFHPSVRVGSFYGDFIGGVPVGYKKDKPRTYGEGNLRFLIPNNSQKTETDRWYVGFKAVYVEGTNNDNARTTTILSQFHFAAGLML